MARRRRVRKLFVWDGVLTDYTDGIMFALAEAADDARRAIREARGETSDENKERWGPEGYKGIVYDDLRAEPQVFDPAGDEAAAFIVWGGG